MKNVACPRCSGPVDPGFRFCKCCGLDLAYPHALQFQSPPPVRQMEHDTKKLLLVLIATYGEIVFTFLFRKLAQMLDLGWVITRLVNNIAAAALVVFIAVMAVQVKKVSLKILLWIIAAIECVLLVRILVRFWHDYLTLRGM